MIDTKYIVKWITARKGYPTKRVSCLIYTGDISAFGKISHTEEFIYRYILAYPRIALIVRNIPLSARRLGTLCGKNHRTISYAIKRMIKSGNLVLIDDKIVIRKHSYCYLPKGVLLFLCEERLKSLSLPLHPPHTTTGSPKVAQCGSLAAHLRLTCGSNAAQMRLNVAQCANQNCYNVNVF